jgi:hypothetical protein
VGKRSRTDVAQSAYEETALEHDPEVTTAKVGNKIYSLGVSYREALGFENQTRNGKIFKFLVVLRSLFERSVHQEARHSHRME